jgi:nucleoside 2-deoxyribosyltransferase
LQTDFNPTQEDLIGISYSHDAKEASILVHYLHDEGWLDRRASGICRVTPRGHIAADELRSHRAKSSQGFVAMWFATEMKPIYDDGLSIGIGNAGYKSMRVDQKEHANKIDDEIRRSAFVVADFTGHRGGVYFEAGFAMGLGLPVIWTCRKDHISDLHFDIRQYNCIDWSEADELATRLQQRVEAMLGHGPLFPYQQDAPSLATWPK